MEQIFETPLFYGVVSDEGRISGFAMGFSEPWHEGFHFYLKEMCVHPDHQRQGRGTLLMKFLVEQLQVLGVKRIYLLTARDDLSEAFYSKIGFYVSPKMIMMAQRLE